MNKSTIFYTILFLCVAATVKAQITVNESDIQGLIGSTYDVNSYETTTGSDLTNLASIKGANQTFDFTAISSFSLKYQGKIQYVSLPADVPGASNPDFANANAVLEINLAGTGQTADSTEWAFLQTKADGMYAAGVVYISPTDVNGDGKSPDTLTAAYNPYLLTSKLPLTYQTSWKDTTTSTVSIGTTNYLNQTVQTDAVVDGYGTLKIPNKTADCLRLKVTTTTITSYMGVPISNTTSESIQYITKSGAAIRADIELDSNGSPVSASYTEVASGTPIEKTPGQDIAKNFRLDQNYPNPFNPSTVISYNLKQATPVKLNIYNSLGQQVATLVNGTQAAGIHKVTFNAAGLNSGLYFYKLQAGSFVQTKKMMLIK
ncbi:MAG TPA: T9SS type A sorting domain-containing protein [Balneolales bacterium]|nr:T9SS type A sorting domain-containing protein [Balneolales bacterium]